MSGQRMEDVVLAPARKREEGTGGGKRKTMPLSEGDVVLGEEGNSEKKVETPAPKPRRKRGEPAEDGDGRRRRKPKPTVEVNSTFTELRRLLQEMRPSTLQVLRTPYYRNCKAARNMRKGVRQIRDFCKQVRLETVMLAKKKQGEDVPKKKKKPEVGTPSLEAGEEVSKKRRKPASPPLEAGEEISRKKKKPEVVTPPLEVEEEVSRKRKKPEIATPPLDDTVDDDSGVKTEVATPPLEVTVDDESLRELEVATPPLHVTVDDES